MRNVKPEVREMAEAIVKREGGLVDDPNDRGGITQWGVSLRYIRGAGIDINGDGVVDEQDIIDCTPAQAVELYLDDFFFEPRFDDLPEVIQEQVFDCSVHHGPGQALKFVQSAANDLRFLLLNHTFDKLAVDGGMGPKTAAATNVMASEFGVYLNTFIVRERQRFMLRITVSRPKNRRFIHGWLDRAEHFVADDD